MAPALANCIAAARPMPEAQPVMTTFLPVRSVTWRQLVLFMVYLPTAAWFVFWMFALEDLLQALSLYLLYVLLAGLPLLLLGRLIGFWSWLRHTAPWLLPPNERTFLP